MRRSMDDLIDMTSGARREELLRRAVETFQRRFARRPAFAAAAPGRINLIGEHTDYNQGFVLPMAIDRFTVIVAAPAAGSESVFFSSDLDQAWRADLTKPLKPIPGSPVNYLLGVADQFRRLGRKTPNLDAAIVSNIPIGAGLSSSAAVEVAFATLLEQVTVDPLDPMEKILLCQRAEHAFPGTPCGVMDMFIIAAAKQGHALLIDCESNAASPARLPASTEFVWLVFDTRTRHDLASSQYAARRETCRRVAMKLGIPSLRHATEAMIGAARLDEVERRRALHVVRENDRTLRAAADLGAGRIESFGRSMFESHDSLRDLYEVTCPELDVVTDAARGSGGAGVLGARMTGGGFGGCVIALCRRDGAIEAQARVSRAFLGAFGRPCAAFACAAAAGAAALALDGG